MSSGAPPCCNRGPSWRPWPAEPRTAARPTSRAPPAAPRPRRRPTRPAGGRPPDAAAAAAPIRAVVAGIQLRQPVVERLGRREQAVDQLRRRRTRIRVTRHRGQAEQRDRGVVRPDRATVVGHRIVRRVQCRHGAQAVSAGQRRRAEQPRHRRTPRRRGQHAGAEQMTDVAGQRVDRAAVAVERQRRVRPRVGRPPRTGRGTGWRAVAGVVAPAVRAVRNPNASSSSAASSAARCAYPCTSQSAIGGVGDPAVAESDRRAGVLPTLVGQAAAGACRRRR